MNRLNRSRLAEAIALWRLRLPVGHQELIDAAVQAVACGCDSRAVAELAGSESDNPFVIDAAIERAIADIALESLLQGDLEVVAVRKFARDLVEGRIGERTFSRWIHQHFHHEAESEMLNRLAELDDDLDELGYAGQDLTTVRAEIRATAEAILGA